MTPPILGFDGEYKFLSNFFIHEIIDKKGNRYPSSEHAYQACKAACEFDFNLIREAPTPNVAKKIGRKITKRPDWEAIKLEVMLKVVRIKFSPGSELAMRLMETGDAELVEENTWKDTYWGRVDGKGCNFLGQILMHVREELLNGKESEEDFKWTEKKPTDCSEEPSTKQ